ncbi:hypothetical protein TGAM01_v204716 [Trichoderma gamsii]|uniref:Uncharacterized protein n=1 Tax=Trichoderma gamsii TaxID=398673 RepID=A0A2P4ZPL2_9HYPO|nr:hypothetical protein TGAM01_v204716 [Trichoderma gamsii]PON26240.1 hypothetical protein TGAM01_v204716 [Trichoderma gamsii]
MPSPPSANVAHNGSDGSGKPTTATSNGDSQGSKVYQDESINRFLADGTQRGPVGFGPDQTQSEAETAGEVRMFENLRAFDVQFGCDKSLKAKPEQK